MKTTITLKMAIVAAFTFLLSFLPQIGQAQVNSPYTIKNKLNCSVVIKYTFYTLDLNNNCVVCNGGSTTIPANSSFTLIDADFGTCWPACDLDITVVQIGGSTAGLPVTANSSNPTPALPAVLGCNTGFSSMSWSLFGCVLIP